MSKETITAVVGGGIIGVFTAYELRKRGADVVLIDRDEPGRGCSYGNSGAISSSSIVPLAMPGILQSVPSMLLDPNGPLSLPWSYLPRALPWLTRFMWSARPARVEESAARLVALHAGAVDRHEALAREVGVPELILRRGHLHLYPDERALAKDAAGWDLRRRHGCQFERIDRNGILALEPAINERYNVGIFLADQATIRNPFRYVQAVLTKFLEIGGKVERAEVQSLRAAEGGWQLKLGQRTQAVHQVVVAAGAYSPRLLDPLGVRLPLETQRGYHVQFQIPSMPVSRTVVLTDHKVFITPMEEGLRVGGTVEFGGLDMPANSKRAEVLMRIALDNFDGLAGQPYSTWMGHRPCMPDSVPVIGQAPHQRGLWLAVGHGHLGLTDSVHTAELVANGLMGESPSR